MDCILGLPFWDILGWRIGRRLLDLGIFDSIKVAGDLEISSLHMGVNHTYQLPHAGGILFVSSISLILNWGKRSWVWNLLWVPQWGIFGHSHRLKGYQPPFPEPMKLGLMDNRLHRVFSIREAFVVPLLLVGFKGHFQVSYLVNLGQIWAFCLCQFKFCAPQFNLHLDQLPFRHQLSFLNRLCFFLSGLSNRNVLKGLLLFGILSKLLQPLVKDMG